MTTLVMDLQSVASSVGEKTRAELEKATAGAERCREVAPQALAIPTQHPLDSFDARTWPAAYAEWWFGDGAPNLQRDRPMLFEETARMLIEREELEYDSMTDTEQYKASGQSRFDTPELVSVLGDVVRRLALLSGTRAAMGRKGFVGDVKLIASATVDDYMEARNIAKPNETIGSAASRPEMPVKVKAAMRSLLLSTANVPATEGRKAALRFNGHGANLCFGTYTFS